MATLSLMMMSRQTVACRKKVLSSATHLDCLLLLLAVGVHMSKRGCIGNLGSRSLMLDNEARPAKQTVHLC